MKPLMTVLAIGVTLLAAGPCLAQPDPDESDLKEDIQGLREDLRAIKDGLRAIYRELGEIKTLLNPRETKTSAPGHVDLKDVVVSVDDDPVKGDPAARVTMIEFSDYQCPFCARFARETLPRLEAEYIKTGKVRYVFRDFPLASIHKEAVKAAQAAHCAGDQAKYWEMHDRLFANQGALRIDDLQRHAQALALNPAEFDTCLQSGKYAQDVQKDLEDGLSAGVRGTPTFFFGLTNPATNTIQGLKAIAGAHAYAAFKEAIDSLLADQKP